jgi:MtN3 and saliva related transmembrane protein
MPSPLLLFIFEILASVSGVMMASSGFPQAFKIFKRKSARDISLPSRLMMLIGGLIWLIYGILLSSFAIIISNVFGTIAEIIVIIGYIRYK